MANFYDILKNVCVIAHEDLPSSFSSTEEPYTELKQHIKSTVEEVCSKFPWTFRERKYNLSTIPGQREYLLPDGITVSNIIKNGVRINNSVSPLYFVFHDDLDKIQLASGKPYRYSAYSADLILDPVPDAVYSVQVKYLTVNFASDADSTITKANLELEDDKTIIPDRYVKVLEWGAYSLYRQNFKPDEKYKFAREKFLQYLLDMQKQDSYGGDESARIFMTNELDINGLLAKSFFDSRI